MLQLIFPFSLSLLGSARRENHQKNKSLSRDTHRERERERNHLIKYKIRFQPVEIGLLRSCKSTCFWRILLLLSTFILINIKEGRKEIIILREVLVALKFNSKEQKSGTDYFFCHWTSSRKSTYRTRKQKFFGERRKAGLVCCIMMSRWSLFLLLFDGEILSLSLSSRRRPFFL